MRRSICLMRIFQMNDEAVRHIRTEHGNPMQAFTQLLGEEFSWIARFENFPFRYVQRHAWRSVVVEY
jgi:hypothetical protein